MGTDGDKPKTAADFRKEAEPILLRLGKDAVCQGHPRRSALSKDAHDLIQELLAFGLTKEQGSESRRIEITKLNIQMRTLRGIIGDRVRAGP